MLAYVRGRVSLRPTLREAVHLKHVSHKPFLLTIRGARCNIPKANQATDILKSIRGAIPGVPDDVLQQALADYPDLAEVDEEHVQIWLSAAPSLLKLSDEEVQACCRQHPWLLLTDLLVIKTAVGALARVLSVEEEQAARTALTNPDILELNPINLMEHLAYVSGTTGMSYETVVQLGLACPDVMLSQSRDIVRAWADVLTICRRNGKEDEPHEPQQSPEGPQQEAPKQGQKEREPPQVKNDKAPPDSSVHGSPIPEVPVASSSPSSTPVPVSSNRPSNNSPSSGPSPSTTTTQKSTEGTVTASSRLDIQAAPSSSRQMEPNAGPHSEGSVSGPGSTAQVGRRDGPPRSTAGLRHPVAKSPLQPLQQPQQQPLSSSASMSSSNDSTTTTVRTTPTRTSTTFPTPGPSTTLKPKKADSSTADRTGGLSWRSAQTRVSGVGEPRTPAATPDWEAMFGAVRRNKGTATIATAAVGDRGPRSRVGAGGSSDAAKATGSGVGAGEGGVVPEGQQAAATIRRAPPPPLPPMSRDSISGKGADADTSSSSVEAAGAPSGCMERRPPSGREPITVGQRAASSPPARGNSGSGESRKDGSVSSGGSRGDATADGGETSSFADDGGVGIGGGTASEDDLQEGQEEEGEVEMDEELKQLMEQAAAEAAAEDEAAAALAEKVRRVLMERPQLLVMRREDIRRELGVGQAVAAMQGEEGVGSGGKLETEHKAGKGS